MGSSVFKTVWDRGWASDFLDGHPGRRGGRVGVGGVSLCEQALIKEVEQRTVICAWAWTKPNQKKGLGTQMGKRAAPYRQLALEKSLWAKQWRKEGHLPEVLPVHP